VITQILLRSGPWERSIASRRTDRSLKACGTIQEAGDCPWGVAARVAGSCRIGVMKH
jgi:hypothetical protein